MNSKEQDDMIDVMRTEQGRRLVMRLLVLSGINRTSYSIDGGTEFREGARNVGLQLQSMVLRADKDLYLKMITEDLED